MSSSAVRAVRLLSVLNLICILLWAFVSPAAGAPSPVESSKVSPVIVLGFLGGFVRHDDNAHSVVQLATQLRREYGGGAMIIETFENQSGEAPHQRIRTLLDADHNGNLSDVEKRDARIILYGHSWGASEVIEIARRLEKDGIPVLLTIQVDSVQKLGENDE